MVAKTKVKCPYSEKCVDVDRLCSSCINNEQRSYYQPYRYEYPYYPPNWPTWGTTTCIGSMDLTNTSLRYQAIT